MEGKRTADVRVVQILKRFEREAHATALLRSTHTVEIFNFGRTDGGDFYYAMELLATMLAARGYSLEYIRQAQGHEGAPQFDNSSNFQSTLKPTMETRHHLKLTTDLIIRELRRRRREA